MNVIETQFRKGEISYLEYKPDLEEDKSRSPTCRTNARARHTRKQSVLTKDINKNYARSMLNKEKFLTDIGSKSPWATMRTNEVNTKKNIFRVYRWNRDT